MSDLFFWRMELDGMIAWFMKSVKKQENQSRDRIDIMGTDIDARMVETQESA